MLGKPEAANSSAAIPRPQALSGAEIDPPLDLVHLARHCMGDRELEDELLRLFLAQSQTLLAQLRDPPLIPLELKAKIAHKMRGSALAVGARRVASALSGLRNWLWPPPMAPSKPTPADQLRKRTP